MEPSLYSLYKESQGTDEYNSFGGQNSFQERNARKECVKLIIHYSKHLAVM